MNDLQTPCPYAADCGGCTESGTPYDRQLQKKQAFLETLLAPFGTVSPILPMPEPYHRRCKVVRTFASVRRDGRFRTVSGIYKEGTRTVVPIDDCMAENETADAVLGTVTALCGKQHIAPYDAQTGRGILRHALVRVGEHTGEVMLVLVTGDAVFPGRNNFVSALRRAHPEITTIVQNINATRTGMLLGWESRTLFGAGYIKDTLSGLSFRISPSSFYQVNPVGAELLYETAIGLADIRDGETVLDAYCGVGTIGLSAAKANPRAHILGIEVNRDAVHDAILNAKDNHIGNARFSVGDAGQFLINRPDLRPDTVIMDPPRTGADMPFLSALLKAAPQKIVYVSCCPDTLARDLAVLSQKYRVTRIQPVDMFPLTGHVETVVCLSRKS